MSREGPQRPEVPTLESARPGADLEGRLVLEAMRGSMFGRREKPLAVGRYELLERLGSGALGLVVAARDPELDRRVAIKLLPARVDSRKLLREARALARLSSPYVVAVLDVGTFEPEDLGTLFSGDPGDPAGTGIWLAMELVDGTPLDSWISKGPHSWDEVLGVFREAAQGLADAHEARIVHRDFKPANVILGHDKRVRVVDFGLARSPNLSFMTSADAAVADDDAALMRGLIGTPAYMSPEQHKGEPTDERADQFSFCVSLYEGLFGDLPYPGPRYEDFMRQKNAGPPPMPSDARVPPEALRALTRGLDPEPTQRFESMRALLDAIDVSPRASKAGSGKLVAGGLVAAGFVGAIYLVAASESDCAVPPGTPQQWSAAKSALVSSVAAADVPFAKVAAFRTSEVLEQRISGWTEVRAATCDGGEISNATEQCLVHSMRGIDATMERLTAMVPAGLGAVESVLEVVPDPARCADSPDPVPDDSRTQAVDLRHGIFTARLKVRGGQAEDGGDSAEAARSAASDLAFDPVLAEAGLVVGEAALARNDWQAASAAFQAAHGVATKAQYSRVAAEAAAGVILAALAGGGDDIATWTDRAAEAIGDATVVEGIAVHTARGEGLAAIGQGDAAIKAFERALAIAAMKSGGAPPRMTVAAHGGLAEVLLSVDRADDANPPAERALSLAESAFGPGHPELARALTRMGRVGSGRGRLSDAETRLRRALQLYEARADVPKLVLADLLVELAAVVSRQGDDGEARGFLERAAELEGAAGARAKTVGALCGVLEARDPTAARKRCEQALQLQRSADASDEVAMLGHEHRLGRVLRRVGALAESETQLASALTRAEKRFGPGHAQTASLLIDFAELRQEQKQPDEAIKLLDRVVALSATLGASDHNVVTAVARRGWLDAENGRAVEAMATIREHARKAGDALTADDRLALSFAEAGAQWATGSQDDALLTARAARQRYARSDEARTEALARIDAWLAER